MSQPFQGRIAFAQIDGSKPVPEFIEQSGDFLSVARGVNPAGDFVLTLKNPIDPVQAVYLGSVSGGIIKPGAVSFAGGTDTTINAQTTDFTALDDFTSFSVVVFVKPSV